jgi:hypothetical protein
MEEWRSYRLSDFALFSARVYRRLFELHNEALWPWQILALALGIVLLFALARRPPRTERMVPALLAAAWLWLAWAFFWRSYATINWAAAYMAPAAALQGVVLLWLAARPGGLPFGPVAGLARTAALALFGASVLLYPLLAPAMGRPWRSAELFGMTPDPTAIGTLAALALGSGRSRWAGSILPALWCAFSGATLWAIGAEAPLLPPLAAAFGLSLAAAGGGRARRAV